MSDGEELLQLLLRPGPPRSEAVAAMTRELTMGQGTCRDRAQVLSRRLLDVGVRGALKGLEERRS